MINEKIIKERINKAYSMFLKQELTWIQRLFKRKNSLDAEILGKMIFSLNKHFNIEFQPKYETLTVEANGTVMVYDLKGVIPAEEKLVYAICDTYLNSIGEVLAAEPVKSTPHKEWHPYDEWDVNSETTTESGIILRV